MDKKYVEFIQRTAAGTLSLHQLRSVRQEITTYRQDIQDRLVNTIEYPEGLKSMLVKCWAKIDSDWTDLDIHERREIMSTLIEAIRVNNTKVHISARV